MSKSPEKNILFSVVGGTALVLGVAYGVAMRDYGNDHIEMLQAELDAQRAASSERVARLKELEADLGAAQTLAEERLATLEAESAEQIARAEREIASLRGQLAAADSGDAVKVAAAGQGAALLQSAGSQGAPSKPLGLGRPAHEEELAAWDVDVLPDGRGLPEGSGDVWTGDEVFAAKCASCHGDFAEGRGAWPPLAGGFETLDDQDPVKTVGSYWPYLSTVWDYVHRSMPFGNAGTLTDDEVYAITAYILYSNNLVADDFTLSKETFDEVKMPNVDGFIVDDRPETEYAMWRGEPCMENCKDAPAEITRRSSDVGVTPADDGSMAESVMEQQLAALGGTEWGKERVAGSVFMGPGGVMQDEPIDEASTEDEADGGTQVAGTETASDADAPDPALVARGETVFRKCSACHAIGEGASNRVGPHLNGVVGRTIGGVDGFRYSGAFEALAEEGKTWDEESLAAFFANPRAYIEGTKMAFAGLRDEVEIEAVIAYLEAASE